MAGGAIWAKKKSGDEDDPEPSASPSSASTASSSSGGKNPMSVSSASSSSFEDDKFHLSADHQPFMLLPGWDRAPQAPEAPEGGGSESGGSGSSGSESSSASGLAGILQGAVGSGSSSGSGSSGSESSSQLPQPAAPPPGFSCSNCKFFKAQGNGTYGCENTDFQRWAGTDRLVETKSGRPVVDPTRACSDWFSPATGPSAQPIPTRHNT